MYVCCFPHRPEQDVVTPIDGIIGNCEMPDDVLGTKF